MLVFLFIAFIGTISAQKNVIQLLFNPMYGNKNILLGGSSFQAMDSNNLQIDALKFYISDIQFLKDEKLILAEPNSFHLIDASQKETLTVNISSAQNIDYNKLIFNLGIDSTTNMAGALGGELDPTKGMYWAWQSGYINFKLEGKSNQCKTRNNEFTFHLGGYMEPFYCLQSLQFSVQKSNIIELNILVQKMLSEIDLATQNHIMSPSKEAVLLSKIVTQSFSVVVK